MTQRGLGVALRLLGGRKHDIALLDDAAVANGMERVAGGILLRLASSTRSASKFHRLSSPGPTR
jgi:hypothetical protein